MVNICLLVPAYSIVKDRLLNVIKRNEVYTIMQAPIQAPAQTVNNVVKWSFFISSATGLMLLGGVFASWLVIQTLVVLTGITA